MTHRLGWLVALVAALALLSTAQAAAAAPSPEVEPNDDLWAANSLGATAAVTGAIGGSGDIDLFHLSLRPGQSVTSTFTHLGGAGECVFSVRSRDDAFDEYAGGFLDESSPPVEEQWETDPEEPLHLVLDVEGGSGCSYSFAITPAAAVIASPARPVRVAVPEPNDEPEQAWGPLKRGVEYTGEFSGFDDSEWLFMHLPAGLTEIELVSPRPDCDLTAYLYEIDDGFESEIAEMIADGATIATDFYERTAQGAAPYLIEVVGDEGCTWGVHIPTALAQGPPPRLGMAAVLKLRLKALPHTDRQLKRRRGLNATCRLSAAARCAVSAWLTRRAAKRIGLSARQAKVRIGAGRATAKRAGSLTVKVRIRRSIRKKLIAAKRPVSATLRATATSPAASPATATKKVKLGG